MTFLLMDLTLVLLPRSSRGQALKGEEEKEELVKMAECCL